MTAPFYTRNGVELYNGDCREILPLLPRAAAHLLITDPPYGTSYRNKLRGDYLDLMDNDAGDLDIVSALSAALRILRNFRHVYCFGLRDFEGLPIGPSAELIWDKGPGTGPLGSTWAPAHEIILFGVYLSSGAHRERGSGKLTARMRQGSVIRCSRVMSRTHPTQKPVKLLRQLIESSSNIGEVVLDPFAGSGSTLKAAALEGRRAIGIETNIDMCKRTARQLDGIFNILEQLKVK